jgi:hypothetical protein
VSGNQQDSLTEPTTKADPKMDRLFHLTIIAVHKLLVPIYNPGIRSEKQENMYGLKFNQTIQVKPLI